MNPWLRSIDVVLEWLYFPIFAFERRWRVILASWLEVDKRKLYWWAIVLILDRTTLFADISGSIYVFSTLATTTPITTT